MFLKKRRTPRSTRTDKLVPYTTHFRSQIIKMVNDASRSRAPIQNLADKVSGYFVPVVVLIAATTFIVWAIWGPEPAYVYAMVNAIAVLRSEEHTSELQSLLRISYAVLCLKQTDLT